MFAVLLNAVLGGSDALYDGIGLVSGCVVLAGVAVNRPRAWPAWIGVGGSLLLFACGDMAYGSGAPSPSFADGLYLAGDLGLIVSITSLVVFAGGRDLGSHLDACLLALIAGVCGWTLFASDALSEGTVAARAVSLAYPVCDLVLLALLLRLVFVRGERTRSYWLLLGAVVTLFVSDGGYVLPFVSSSYQAGGWLDAGWLTSYVLFGGPRCNPR